MAGYFGSPVRSALSTHRDGLYSIHYALRRETNQTQSRCKANPVIMSGIFEPRRISLRDVPVWARESWHLLWRRPLLFLATSLVFHVVAWSVSDVAYVSALIVILLGYLSLLVLINFAAAADHTRAVKYLPTYRMVRRVIPGLLLLTVIYILIYVAVAILALLIEFEAPAVNYYERELYLTFRWVWPGKFALTILYIGIMVTSMWFLPPLLALHELGLGDARKLARRAYRINDWIVFLAAYVPFVVLILLSLVTELSYLLNLLFVPLFALYLYVSYRHVFLGKRENSPVPAKTAAVPARTATAR